MSATDSDPGPSLLSRRIRWVAYLLGAFGLGLNAQGTFLIPLRARELGASFEIIGLIVGAGSLVPGLLSVPLGRVIDRLGPKRSFVLGTSLAALSASMLLLVTNYWALAAVHVTLGIPRILAWIASQTYITGLAVGHERAHFTGRFSVFTNIGTMVGPLAAGIVSAVVGLRLAFLLLVCYAGLFAILGSLLPDTRPAPGSGLAKRPGVGFGTALHLLKIRGIQLALILTFVRLWNEISFSAFFPVYLVDRGMDTALAGTIMFTKGLVATMMASTVAFWSKHVAKEMVVIIGLACGAVGLVVAPHIAVMPIVYLAPMMVGIGAGVSLPLLLSIVSEAAPADQRGVALGLRMSVNQLAGGSAPLLVGSLVAALGTAVAFGTSGVAALGLLLGARALQRLAARGSSSPGTGGSSGA